jgi:hypothetical protein
MVELEKGDRVVSPHGEKGTIVDSYYNDRKELLLVMRSDKLIHYSYLPEEYTIIETAEKEKFLKWLSS